jgi:type II secretory ATPase GspE/PulE/Tfp pilus assembly ATPase PilB-like protein
MPAETHTQTPQAAEKTLDRAVVDMLLQSELLDAGKIHALTERSFGDEAAFERLLLSEGHISEEQLTWVKSQAYGDAFVDLHRQSIPQDVLSVLPATFAKKQRVVPFREPDGTISLAVASGTSRSIRRILRKKFGMQVRIASAMESAVAEVLTRYDGGFQERSAKILARYQEAKVEGAMDDDTVPALVDALLLHGVQDGASDIHLEPRAKDCTVRVRVDGLLRILLRYAIDMHPLLVLRIKVLAGLATDEHTAPQDGKFAYIGPDGKQVDVRVSIVATTHGEKIVLRLLLPQNWALSFEHLGLSSRDRALLTREMERSWGMILATGPTGCGKTTTLYSVLCALNSDDVNLATIEDPVEYDLAGTNQMQVNEKFGITFATGLRSIVRQDPDIILVGEVRDPDTASIAVNAAMTGHLVLSTLHTNDAATAIIRLRNMGVEPFLISSTVNMIIAQRLVRKICVQCRSSIEVSASELTKSISEHSANHILRKRDSVRLYRGKGCDACAGTGYRDRTGIFEVMIVTDAIRSLVAESADAEVLEKAAIQGGMTTMLDDGLEKAVEGITTLEEVLRVIRS